MRAYVAEVIDPSEYKDMSDEELFAKIRDGLYVNEAVADVAYRHKKRAEYIERAIYVCPHCGLSSFESHGSTVMCKRCGLSAEYTERKELRSEAEGFDFGFLADWYDYQCRYVNSLDTRDLTDEPLYTECGDLYNVIRCKKKELIEKGVRINLFGDRVEIKTEEKTLVFSFDTTEAVTVLGRNKLNIYHGDSIYQIKPPKRFNALKYVNLYHRYKNLVKGVENAEFLGL